MIFQCAKCKKQIGIDPNQYHDEKPVITCPDCGQKNRVTLLQKNKCSVCGMSYDKSISECPKCNGTNFRQQKLVEHYNCCEVFPKEVNNKIYPNS